MSSPAMPHPTEPFGVDPHETCVWIPAEDRAFLAAGGPDRGSFLHAMLTQDVRGLAAGDVRYACQLDTKGHMVADAYLWILEDEILLEAPRACAAVLRQALASRIIMDQVEVRDREVAAAWLVGPGARKRLRQASAGRGGPAAPPHGRAMRPGRKPAGGGEPPSTKDAEPELPLEPGRHVGLDLGGVRVLVRSLDWPGVEGFLLAGDAGGSGAGGRGGGGREGMAGEDDAGGSSRGEGCPGLALDGAREALTQAGGNLPLATERTLDLLRVEAGIPRFGADMDETTIPLEARLEDRAISMTKGCYLGQEVIARATFRGHVNRLLAGVAWEGGMPASGEALVREDGSAAGRVTSIVRSPRYGVIGLAMVRRELAVPGTRLCARGGLAATVVALPFGAGEHGAA